MSDLVERLRDEYREANFNYEKKLSKERYILKEAADRIEQLEANKQASAKKQWDAACGVYQHRIEQLEAALERSCTCKVYGMEPVCPACTALKVIEDE